jgi:hypothetical protein
MFFLSPLFRDFHHPQHHRLLNRGVREPDQILPLNQKEPAKCTTEIGYHIDGIGGHHVPKIEWV